MIAGVLCILMLACGVGAALAAPEQPGVAGLSREETLRLGELMYRRGILPSGEPLQATVKGDIPVEGTMFSCESCHLRGGLGSYEGEVITYPTNGRLLYQPYNNGVELSNADWLKIPSQFRAPPRRPAYTDKTLADVLRGGIDPTGRKLNYVMPRYQLDDRDMAILIYYLKALSSEPSPGVTATTLRFATVITDEVRPEDRKAMLAPLEAYFHDRNNQLITKAGRTRYRWGVAEGDLSSRRLLLDRWVLKGPPDTWRGQLEAYYRKEPVFALIGGITYGDWQPIHRFCEDHQVPCVFPITDYPVISETDWYTLYFSKGLYQEGEAAARFLWRAGKSPRDRRVVQIFDDTRQGRSLAAGFSETWQGLGLQAPMERKLPAGGAVTREYLHQLMVREKPSDLLVWLGPGAYPALEGLAADPNRPEMIFVSSSLMKKSIDSLPDSIRDTTYITYPFRMPQDEPPYSNIAMAWLASRQVPINDRRISTRMFTLVSLMTQWFMHMGRNFYRDNFLDVIGMFPDQLYADYERLSFGPGQRYASKGCYIVQLTRGAKPVLVRKSDWVIH
jgi:Periplasmic binding protein